LFTAVYALEGQPALHPWRLALAACPGECHAIHGKPE
jgi:transposase